MFETDLKQSWKNISELTFKRAHGKTTKHLLSKIGADTIKSGLYFVKSLE